MNIKRNIEKIRSDNTNPKYRDLKKRLLDKWKNTDTGKKKIREYSRKRYTKNHRISEEEWYNCKLYFNFRCAYCGKTWEQNFEETGGDLHKEHAVDDGKDNLKNCIPACQSCNSSKREYSLNYWYNPSNPIYTYDRYYAIYLWLRYDHKKYIKKRKPKQKYERKI